MKSDWSKQCAAMGIGKMIPERNERGKSEDEATIAVDAGGTLACEGQGDEIKAYQQRSVVLRCSSLCETVLTVIVILH